MLFLISPQIEAFFLIHRRGSLFFVININRYIRCSFIRLSSVFHCKHYSARFPTGSCFGKAPFSGGKTAAEGLQWSAKSLLTSFKVIWMCCFLKTLAGKIDYVCQTHAITMIAPISMLIWESFRASKIKLVKIPLQTTMQPFIFTITLSSVFISFLYWTVNKRLTHTDTHTSADHLVVCLSWHTDSLPFPTAALSDSIVLLCLSSRLINNRLSGSRQQ